MMHSTRSTRFSVPTRTNFVTTCLLLALLAAPSLAQEVITGSFDFEFLDVPKALNINLSDSTKDGTIGGYYDRPDGTVAAFTSKDGVRTELVVPGSIDTGLIGMNDRGWRVGDFQLPGEVFKGWIFDGEEILVFHPEGSEHTSAMGVNNKDQVVGFVRDTSGFRRGFFWEDGEAVFFGHPDAGPAGTRASDINQKGDIVGFYFDDGFVAHGFVLRKGEVFEDVEFPGGLGTFLGGITENGVITGSYLNEDFAFKSFILDKQGRFITIDVPGSFDTIAPRLTHDARAIGFFNFPENLDRGIGFLATPTVDYGLRD